MFHHDGLADFGGRGGNVDEDLGCLDGSGQGVVEADVPDGVGVSIVLGQDGDGDVVVLFFTGGHIETGLDTVADLTVLLSQVAPEEVGRWSVLFFQVEASADMVALRVMLQQGTAFTLGLLAGCANVELELVLLVFLGSLSRNLDMVQTTEEKLFC